MHLGSWYVFDANKVLRSIKPVAARIAQREDDFAREKKGFVFHTDWCFFMSKPESNIKNMNGVSGVPYRMSHAPYGISYVPFGKSNVPFGISYVQYGVSFRKIFGYPEC